MKGIEDRSHWIFDLDGTLTESVHDFDAFRAELGIAPGVGLLEHIRTLGPERGAAVEARIAAWELEHAELAVAEADAIALLEHLGSRGARLGVLTRNSRIVAMRTLEVAGLARWFCEDLCIGRDEAAPKPAPDGVLHLLGLWKADPGDAVMVGDWIFDVLAGRDAGVATVLVDRDGSASEHAKAADLAVRDLRELIRGSGAGYS
jgi:HAD superfamily hydrolase (TIGR01509 family)